MYLPATKEYSDTYVDTYAGTEFSDAEQSFILSERDTGAREDLYSGMCDCYCESQGCRCDCHDCNFWQNGP